MGLATQRAREKGSTTRATVMLLLSVASLLATGFAVQVGGGICPTEPRLHYSIDSDISVCTSAIHNGSATAWTGFGVGGGQLPELRAEAYYDRGLLYMLVGKTDLAVADFTSAIGGKRTYADAFEARGDAYADLGQPQKAAADYEAARETSGDNPDRLNSRCWVRAVRGHPLDRALADCNESLKGVSDERDVLQNRCFVYFRMGNYTAAVADCAAAEKSRWRYAEALYVGGLAKLRLGDTTGGNADIAAAHDADFEIADLYALYGVKP
jgi:tetratricopeptide (TPR) repeat protein